MNFFLELLLYSYIQIYEQMKKITKIMWLISPFLTPLKRNGLANARITSI